MIEFIENIDSNEIESFLESLKQFRNPEMYHIQSSTHPGINWRLKTICPDPRLIRLDKERLGEKWFNFAESFPDFVQLVDTAFDWQGEPISYTFSVWVLKNYDVIYNHNNDLKLITMGESVNLKIKQIEDSNLNKDIKKKLKEILLNTYRKNVVNFRRNEFQVIRSNDNEG